MKLSIFKSQRLFDNMLFHIDRSKGKALQQFLLFIILNHITIMHSEFISGEVAVALIALYSNILTIVLKMYVIFLWCMKISVAVWARLLQRAVIFQMVLSLRIIEHHLMILHVHVCNTNILRLSVYLCIWLAAVCLVDLI